MIDRLMGALPSTSGGTSDLAWLLVWQSTLWLAVGLLAARVWRRRAGRAHLLLVLAMGAAFVSPVLTVIVHRMQWGFLPPPAEPPPVVVTQTKAPEPATELHHPDNQLLRERAESPEEFAQSELESMPDRSTSAIEPEVATSELPAPVRPLDAATAATAIESPLAAVPWTSRLAALLPTALAAVWSIASFLLMVRLAFSLLAGTRIVRTPREEINPQLVAALGDATRAIGLPSAPVLRASPHIRCPMIWCWGARPVVLLPASAVEAAPILWRSVFCHELAHAIRRDHWTALWAEIVVIALPWQPLAWLSRRRLAYLREQACDCEASWPSVVVLD
jgi:BlaR1 peptidase M56